MVANHLVLGYTTVFNETADVFSPEPRFCHFNGHSLSKPWRLTDPLHCPCITAGLQMLTRRYHAVRAHCVEDIAMLFKKRCRSITALPTRNCKPVVLATLQEWDDTNGNDSDGPKGPFLRPATNTWRLVQANNAATLELSLGIRLEREPEGTVRYPRSDLCSCTPHNDLIYFATSYIAIVRLWCFHYG